MRVSALGGLLLYLGFWMWIAGESRDVGADETLQPYIDQLKRQLPEDVLDEPPGAPESSGSIEPYLDSLRKTRSLNSPNSEAAGSSYSEKLKALDPRAHENPESESFTEVEKKRIGTRKEGGAIQAVLEGRSELHPDIVGKSQNLFGLRYGAALTRNLKGPADVALRDFNSVYGGSYAPDLSLFFEFQPLKTPWLGNIGILVMGGIASFQGTGNLSFDVPRPTSLGGTFSTATSVKFQFFTAPVTVALDYHFTLAKYLQPFLMAGPTVVGYLERRDDGISSHQGFSGGFFASGGVSFLLDWLNPSGAWDLYSNYSIKHYYLTVELSNVSSVVGLVNVNIYGLFAGLSFEY